MNLKSLEIEKSKNKNNFNNYKLNLIDYKTNIFSLPFKPHGGVQNEINLKLFNKSVYLNKLQLNDYKDSQLLYFTRNDDSLLAITIDFDNQVGLHAKWKVCIAHRCS